MIAKGENGREEQLGREKGKTKRDIRVREQERGKI